MVSTDIAARWLQASLLFSLILFVLLSYNEAGYQSVYWIQAIKINSCFWIIIIPHHIFVKWTVWGLILYFYVMNAFQLK